MSAYRELVDTGVAGQATLDMMMSVGHNVVRSRNYPDPTGKGHWTPNDVAELVSDMVVACSQGHTFVDSVLAGSTDDESLKAVIAHRLKNAFADRSRDTDTGHLAGRIDKLLKGNTSLFRNVANGAWTTASVSTGDESEVTREDLLRAAHSVEGVKVVRWSAEADRRSPFASKDDLERLAVAVLLAAGGSLRQGDLTKVLAEYFGLRPNSVSIDDATNIQVEGPEGDPAADAAAADLAGFVWAQLSEDERSVLPWLEDSVSTTAEGLGIKRSRAYTLRKSAQAVLAQALGVDPSAGLHPSGEAAGVFAMLQERARTETRDGE